jgi:hypothetical protein
MASDQESKQSQSSREQCIASSKKTGKRCQGIALPGSPFCFAHDVRFDEQRAAGRIKGGYHRANLMRLHGLMPPRLLPVFEQLGTAMADVRTGKLDPKIGNSMAVIARAMVAVLQVGELEQRVRDIEAKAQSLSDPTDRRFP